MQEAIIIRVEPENFDVWRHEHEGQRDIRSTYGITDGPVYRDEKNTKTVLVHLNVENLDRALQFFQSDDFKGAVQRAGNVQREIWLAHSRT